MNDKARRTGIRSVVAATAAALLLLSSCGSGSDSSTDPDIPTKQDQDSNDTTSDTPGDDTESSGDDVAAGEPKTGGVLRVLLLMDGDDMDPLTTHSWPMMLGATVWYNQLVTRDADGEVVPSLAREWSISDDGLTYTFDLETGVKFHNGDDFTSDDVAFAIERLTTTEGANLGATFKRIVASVETPEPDQVVIHLTQPFSPFLSLLSHPATSIVSSTAAAAGTLSEEPVGTGPFQLKAWNRNQSIEVEKNSSYWKEGLPYLDGITFTFNAESNAAFSQLVAGDVDFWRLMDETMLEQMDQQPGVKYVSAPETAAYDFLGLNPNQAPFDSLQVRQAVYYGIDNAEVVEACQPTSIPLNDSIATEGSYAGASQADRIYGRDVDKARSLLESAGYGDGFSFTINALHTVDTLVCYSEIVQAQLSELGITVDIVPEPLTSWLSMHASGQYQAVMGATSGSVDIGVSLGEWYSSTGASNYVGYSNPEVDALLDEAYAETDLSEREAIYIDAQRKIFETGYHFPISTWEGYNGMSVDVQGYELVPPQPQGFWSFEKTWLDR